MTLYVVDLFCGAGGFSEGARQAGAQVVLAVDSWQRALDVHKANHPGSTHIQRTLGGNMDEAYAHIVDHIPALKEDDRLHIHASPPCQNLTTINANRHETNGMNLFRWTVAFVEKLAETYCASWTIEQVDTPNVRRALCSSRLHLFSAYCYRFGIPQRRRRIVITNSEYLLRQLLCYTTEVVSLSATLGRDVSAIAHRRKKWVWEHSPSVYYTVTSTFSNYIIKSAHVQRVMTIEDGLLLQTFPVSYSMPSITKKDKQRMIANAVPPRLARVICLSLPC